MPRNSHLIQKYLFIACALCAIALANPDTEKLRLDLKSLDESRVTSALNTIVKSGGTSALLEPLVELGTNAQFLMLSKNNHSKLIAAIEGLNVEAGEKYGAMFRIAAVGHSESGIGRPIYRYLSAQEQLTDPAINRILTQGGPIELLALLGLFNHFPLERKKSLAATVFTKAFMTSNIECLHVASIELMELIVEHGYRPTGQQRKLLGASLALALLQPVEGLRPEEFGRDNDPRLGLAQASAALLGKDEGLAVAMQKVFAQVRHNLTGSDQEAWLSCINEAKGRPRLTPSLESPARDHLNKELSFRRGTGLPPPEIDSKIVEGVARNLRVLDRYERREYLEQLLQLPEPANTNFKRLLVAELRSTNDDALTILEGHSDCAKVIRRLSSEPPSTDSSKK